MKIKNCTKKEGIELLELAGFKVVESEHTFSIWKDDKKIYGCSNKNWLTCADYLMKNFIQGYYHKKGAEKGKQQLRTEFKNLLEL